MTGLERYRNMIEGKPCDIVPRVPILMQFAAEYIGSNTGPLHRTTASSSRPICAAPRTSAWTR